MIHSDTFSKEWIQSLQETIPGADPGVIEKLLRAYSLTEELVKAGLDFVFKGGTCLTLLTNKPRRFSTDVDVITQASQSEIERALSELCINSEFLRFELDSRRSFQPGIPKAHYKLFFQSALDGDEKPILLDLLFTDTSYPQLQSTPIRGDLIKLEGEATYVRTPTLDGLLGDKLTAFAPTTTGVLYGSRKELEIIKQLFDLGVMYDDIDNFINLRESFNAYVEKELSYRVDLDSDRLGVLLDTFHACEVIIRRETQLTKDDEEQFAELQQGLRRFRGFTIDEPFRIENAAIAASKVALIVAKLISDDFSPVPIAESGLDRSNYLIPNKIVRYNYLNRKLRSIEPSAQFYWYSALKILNKI